MDTLTADMLAETLQEPKKFLLARVLRTLGQERCQALYTEARTIEASGGMLTPAGDRRRTPGGVFFALAKQQCSQKEWYLLFFRPQPPLASSTPQRPSRPQAPSWEDIRMMTDTLQAAPPGEATTMKATLVGRPGTVETRQTCVVFQMQGRAPGPLPKGLPPVPKTPPITWTVIVALRQWNRVRESLAAHADDQLIIEGYPCMQGTQPVLLAQSCTSVLHQRQRQATQRAQAAPPPED